MRSNRDTVPGGWAQSTQWVAMADSQLVGMIQIRHEITGSAYLAQYGSQIGYSVRPSQRRQSHAKQILRLVFGALQEFGSPAGAYHLQPGQ